MTGSEETGRTTSRRTMVAAAGAVGLTAALAACGESGGNSTEASPGTEKPAGDAPAKGSGGGKSGGSLGKTSDVPEGGGTVFAEQKVVVTQPEAGRFKAFSAVCTHRGCTIADVSGGTINCPCHGSKFDIADGSVKHGPAQQPLPAAEISVEGGSITLK